ncbi:hypothetical protein PCANC_20856 [Puccinia coronata f. sp. avenae]|uniref:Uncharacterized protein n=1 Tax=Puccinia coronata f. sp. avenae TaxID=200324 RepID=A0A2N5S7N5_9BASI|nr:hypothetical protein PCANC_20856 [Puccinia coronata f. sp. avenae]
MATPKRRGDSGRRTGRVTCPVIDRTVQVAMAKLANSRGRVATGFPEYQRQRQSDQLFPPARGPAAHRGTSPPATQHHQITPPVSKSHLLPAARDPESRACKSQHIHLNLNLHTRMSCQCSSHLLAACLRTKFLASPLALGA